MLIPLPLALLFSFLLEPPVRRLERHGLWRVPAVLEVALTFFCLFGLVGWLMASQIINLAGKTPTYQSHLQHKLDSLRGRGGALQKAAQVIETVQRQVTYFLQEPHVDGIKPFAGPLTEAGPKFQLL